MAAHEAAEQIARGMLLQKGGDLHGAVACYREALRLDKSAYHAHNNLGSVFASLGDRETALVFFRAALEGNPADAKIWSNLGKLHLDSGKWEKAVESYHTAARLDPSDADHHNQLGNALRVAGRYGEAQAALERSIALRPGFAEAYTNLGTCFWEGGQAAEAEACWRRAIAEKPDLAQAHANLGKLLLSAGEFEAGWLENEWRWGCKDLLGSARRFNKPQWKGEPIAGERLLLHAEQGFGDTIQFARYAPLDAERGARVTLEVQPSLVSLMRSLPGVDEVVPRGERLPEFDWHCPLMSLPLALRTRLGSIPASIPYLHADPSSVQSTTRVGLVWAGDPSNANDRFRSIPFEALAPLSGIAGVEWVSLQRGPAAWKAQAGPVRFAEQLPEEGDWAATAAVVAGLHLVITVDSAVAHLAGALGKPVFILVPAVSDWRWLKDRGDSPWYPTARLFRQEAGEPWVAAVERLVHRLKRFVGSRVPTTGAFTSV